jgi:hypothetical protein
MVRHRRAHSRRSTSLDVIVMPPPVFARLPSVAIRPTTQAVSRDHAGLPIRSPVLGPRPRTGIPNLWSRRLTVLAPQPSRVALSCVVSASSKYIRRSASASIVTGISPASVRVFGAVNVQRVRHQRRRWRPACTAPSERRTMLDAHAAAAQPPRPTTPPRRLPVGAEVLAAGGVHFRMWAALVDARRREGA